jgi:hypothetical protein
MHKKRNAFTAILILALLIAPATLEAKSLSPLVSQDANVIDSGDLEIRLGTEYFEDLNLAFDPSDNLDRDVWNIPTLDILIGAGRVVEIQAYFDGIYVDEDGSGSEYGAGDLELFTKIQLRQEDDMPALGFRFGTKLPNASNEDRLGTDEFDFLASFLLSKHLGSLETHLNLGMGILGSPYQNSNQDDVLLYGAGFIIPTTDKLNLALEFNGQACSDDNNDFSHIMAGFQYYLRQDTRLDVGASAGLSDESQDWSVKCGISRSFDNLFFSKDVK